MGFCYGSTRTPYEVQHDNGQRFDFDKIKQHYEQIKPIRGKRAHLNIRPISERDRSAERIIKVGENEYYITFNAYRWNEINQPDHLHTKAISFHQIGEMETVVVHTPRTNWKGKTDLYPRAFSNSSVFYFYHFNLPNGLNMVNHKSCKYLRVDNENGYLYYTVEKGDITLTRKKGDKYWKPMVVHREVVHALDKAKTKEWRTTAKPLLDYLNIMVDVVEPQYLGWWENTLAKATTNIPKDELFKQPNGEAPEHWFKLAEYYKKRIESTDWGVYNNFQDRKTIYRKDKLKHYLYKDLYKLVKPLRTIEVPLGTVCKDRFKSWFTN
jgi:hypothetical protein